MFLFLGAEEMQVLLHFTVHNFGLTIRLWVMCGRELRGNSESLADVRHDLRGELWTTIRDNGARKSVILPDMEKVEFCGVQSRSGLIARNELRFLGEAVDHGENAIESVGKGKIGDEVRANIHPRHHAWLKWDSSAGRLCVASFEVCTPITAGDVRFDIGGQPGPIVMAFNEFLGFLITRVASDRGVMMGSDDLHTERIIVRDVHLTRGVVEEAIVFLTDSFLFA